MADPLARRRTGQLLHGIAALTTLAVLLAGVPTALYMAAGSPVPHTLPSWEQVWARARQPDDGTLLLLAVKLIGWVCWAIFVASIITEIADLVRGSSFRLPAPARPAQRLARNLLASAALIFTTTGPLSPATGAGPLAHTATPADNTTPPHTTADSPHAASPVPTARPIVPAAAHQPLVAAHHRLPAQTADQPREHAWRTHVVKRGDTLWAIARHAYGTGMRYPQIFQASRHLEQPGRLPPVTDPDQIYPGQHVKIPHPRPAKPALQQPAPSKPPPDQQPPAHTLPAPGASAHPHRSPQNPPPTETASPPAAANPTPNYAQPTNPPTAPRHTPNPTTPASTPSSPTTAPTRPPTPATGTHTPAPTSPTPTAPAPSTHSPSPPPTSPMTRPASPAPRESSQAPKQPRPDNRSDEGPVTVALRTGGYIGLGLAAAVSIALALTRAHRRHQRPHLEEWPPPDEPEPEVPEPVGQIRRSHMNTLARTGQPTPTDEDLIADDFAAPEPARIALGTQSKDGKQTWEVTVDLAGLSLGLTGPGALDAARAAFVELLARSRRGRVELLLTRADADTLLDGTGISPTRLAEAVDGLILLPDTNGITARLETEILHRRRLMTYHDVDDVVALRTADPAEPLPAIIVIATPPPHDQALQAALALGGRYCIGALVLGTWPGPTLHADTGGTATPQTPGADAWAGVRLFHITPTETTGILHTIITASGTTTTPPAKHVSSRPHEPIPPQTRAPDRSDTDTGRTRPALAPGGQPPHPEPEEDRPVTVRVLGPIRIEAHGQPITSGIRTTGYTLLLYLTLNPQGVTRDQGITALWPEDPPTNPGRMFHTAVNNLRRALRAATGLREPMFITLTTNRYRLDPTLIHVDLWHLQHTIETAQQATDDTTRLHALQQIPDLYTAELATDIHHEWAETHRERLRRHGTDALVYLARLTQNTNPDQALAALEQAITHDPYTEPVYRSIMRIQARQHRPDAVQRTYHLLETRLAELDTDPTAKTRQLLTELVRPSPSTHPNDHRPSRPLP